jgi:hypothetical protein
MVMMHAMAMLDADEQLSGAASDVEVPLTPASDDSGIHLVMGGNSDANDNDANEYSDDRSDASAYDLYRHAVQGLPCQRHVEFSGSDEDSANSDFIINDRDQSCTADIDNSDDCSVSSAHKLFRIAMQRVPLLCHAELDSADTDDANADDSDFIISNSNHPCEADDSSSVDILYRSAIRGELNVPRAMLHAAWANQWQTDSDND